MKDSIVGDAWIKQACDAIPVQYVFDDKGEQTTNFLTGPVRLAWPNIFELPKPSPTQQNPKYGASVLFTPYVDWTIFTAEYNRILAETFASYYNPSDGQYYGLHSPFRQQAEKAARFKGFTTGLTFITATSKFKPPVVDTQFNPIFDPARIYPGVWACLAINAYAYGVNPPQPKKGVGFGIQSVMILGDDMMFGGGAADPKQQFARAQGAPPSVVRPDMTQMGRVAGGGAPSAPGMPPMGGSPGPLPPAAPYPAAAPSPNAPFPPPAPGPHGTATPYPTETPEQAFQREMRENGLA